MTHWLKSAYLVTCVFLFSSCSSVSIKDYAGAEPKFDFENFFSGGLEAHGVFQDRSGKVLKQIHCEMNVTKAGDEWIIDEKFEYSDGTRDSRIWRIKKIDDEHYEGTAGDVVGVAKIETAGFAFHMNYRLRVKVDGKEIEVTMDDWMYRVNDRLVVNKTRMSKWGVHLGEVSLAILKK
jgi:hypothetical protein